MWGFPHNRYMPRVTAREKVAIRRRLIEAGKAEFAARGLAGARFDEISVAAGHAKGTIYNYFPNKEALFFEIVGEWCALMSEPGVVPDDPRSARERLLAIARLDVEIARKDPDLSLVVVQQMPALLASHGEAVVASIAPGLELLTQLMAEGLADGEFSSDLGPEVLARLFLTSLSAFETEALMPDPIVTLDDVVDLVDVHFITGLLT